MTDYPLTWLADVLRDAGCRVREESGWKTRGRPASSGSFKPRAVLRHWDASAKGSHGAISTVINGSSSAPGPLCSILTCRGNDDHGPAVHVIAAGRTNHGGEGDGWGQIPPDDANTYAVGHEIAHTTDEKWDDDQLDQVRMAEAAILTRLGAKPSNALPCHAEYAPGRKIDTTGGSHGQNMSAERDAVADQMSGQGAEPMRYFNYSVAAPLQLGAGKWTRAVWTKETADEGKWHADGNAGVYVGGDVMIVCGVYAQVTTEDRVTIRVTRAASGSKPGEGTVLGESDRDGSGPLTLFCPPMGGADSGIFVELLAAAGGSAPTIQLRGTVSPRG